jgi:hypothetical protein
MTLNFCSLVFAKESIALRSLMARMASLILICSFNFLSSAKRLVALAGSSFRGLEVVVVSFCRGGPHPWVSSRLRSRHEIRRGGFVRIVGAVCNQILHATFVRGAAHMRRNVRSPAVGALDLFLWDLVFVGICKMVPCTFEAAGRCVAITGGVPPALAAVGLRD